MVIRPIFIVNPYFKSFFAIAGLIIVVLSLVISVSYIAWRDVATGKDAEISSKIWHELSQIVSNSMINADVIVVPARGKSTIQIYGNLNDIDKEHLSFVATNISRSYTNRIIAIEFFTNVETAVRERASP